MNEVDVIVYAFARNHFAVSAGHQYRHIGPNRPDLLESAVIDENDRKLLEELRSELKRG